MITILHNPRCAKSRQGISLLETYGAPFKVVKYLEDPISEKQLKSILKQLKMEPIDLVRKNEAIWKNEFKNKELSDDALISAMVTNPKLIERPIVINDSKAVVGRPTEKILDLLK